MSLTDAIAFATEHYVTGRRHSGLLRVLEWWKSWLLGPVADPRTTEHYDRAHGNLDGHGVHLLTAYVAGV